MLQVEIRIKEQINERWSEWLDGLTIIHTEDETVLTGPILDQSALYGLMSKLRDLGLSLLVVKVSGRSSMGEKAIPCQNGSALSSAPLSSDRRHRQRW